MTLLTGIVLQFDQLFLYHLLRILVKDCIVLVLSGGIPLPSGDMEKIHRPGDAHSSPDRSNFCGRDFSSILGDSSVQMSLQPRPMKLSPQRKFFPVRLGASRDAIC